jgi:hypothetical protein
MLRQKWPNLLTLLAGSLASLTFSQSSVETTNPGVEAFFYHDTYLAHNLLQPDIQIVFKQPSISNASCAFLESVLLMNLDLTDPSGMAKTSLHNSNLVSKETVWLIIPDTIDPMFLNLHRVNDPLRLTYRDIDRNQHTVTIAPANQWVFSLQNRF